MSRRDRPSCGKCDVSLGRFGQGTKMVPMTDGLGNFYMARVCRNCSAVLTRIFPTNGNELRWDLRSQAVQDSDPPPRSEIPE